MKDSKLIQDYLVYFSSEDIENLPEEKQKEIYEYLRIYAAEVEHMIRKADRKHIEVYKVTFPGYLVEQLTGTKIL